MILGGVAKDLDTRIFLAPPYAFWKRGVNENTDGLLRQFFPKNRDLAHVTEYELKEVMAMLNHRFRKMLGYRTSHEVCFDTTTPLTVALASFIQAEP